jgi:hypothetical protein
MSMRTFNTLSLNYQVKAMNKRDLENSTTSLCFLDGKKLLSPESMTEFSMKTVSWEQSF